MLIDWARLCYYTSRGDERIFVYLVPHFSRQLEERKWFVVEAGGFFNVFELFLGLVVSACYCAKGTAQAMYLFVEAVHVVYDALW